MDIKEIQNLIKFVQKSGVEEVKIERENFKITIRTKPDSKQNIIVQDIPVSFPLNLLKLLQKLLQYLILKKILRFMLKKTIKI